MRTSLTLMLAAVTAAGQISAQAGAAERVPLRLTYSQALTQRLQDRYGVREGDVLRAAVADAVAKALHRTAYAAASARGASIAVTLVDAAPTHPTRKQALDNPSLDPLRSVSLGGADLTGKILAADGHALATVHYEYFAPEIALVSPAADPWADARIAIARFSSKIAANFGALFRAKDRAVASIDRESVAGSK